MKLYFTTVYWINSINLFSAQLICMKMVFRFLLTLLALALSYVIIIILWNAITYYKPKPNELIQENAQAASLPSGPFKLLLWNIGYAGLGQNADFFFDGGQQVRSPKYEVLNNFDAMVSSLQEQPSDFIMLQEVDVHSKRSYWLDERARLRELAKYSQFAKNYDVHFVPLKWTDPMGRVVSGLQNITDYEAVKSYRVQLPGSYPFPDKYFFLRRCLIVQEFALADNKKLVLVNLHLSAFNDQLQKEELKFISHWIEPFNNENTYIILGGDWNIDPQAIQPYFKNKDIVYDTHNPTNRSVNAPLNSETTFQTIDYFVCSKNIKVMEVKVLDKGFKHSDHQPVQLLFECIK